MMSNGGGERLVANRYVIRRELGRGGMGIVWEAHDPELRRDVAIKQVMLPDHFTPAERDDALARVRREARSAARVSHPTVITIHDVFEWEGSPWVVMELIEGGSLKELLDREGALDPAQVARIGDSLLRAVHYANEVGVLHRDIKPGNIMMSADGRVVLTDFGIATIEGGPSITRTGALVGSPEYMAPERLEGGEAEHRNDLWSIGVTLYTAVEGRSPFGRDTITAAIAAVISGQVPPMQRAGWLEPVISGLLERDPEQRLGVDQASHMLSTPGAGVQEAQQAPGGPQEAHHGSGAAVPPSHSAHDAYAYPGHRARGGAPDGRRQGVRTGTMLALGAGGLAVVVGAGAVLYAVGNSGGDEGGEQLGVPPSEERPDTAPVPDGTDDQASVDEDEDPPGYDDHETFRSDSFTVGYPQGWQVDDADIDQNTAMFYPSGYDQQVWVSGWTEPLDAGSSHDYLVETEGGTVDDPSTGGFEQLEVGAADDDDTPEGWDAAGMEARFTNDTWPTPERHYWVYALTTEHQGEQVMYNVSVNVPREQEDFYDDLPQEIMETFTPHL